MINNKRTILSSLFVAMQIASAQPVIEMNDVLSFLNTRGMYEFSTSADIELDLKTPGENRTWDFRKIDMGMPYQEQNQLLTADNHPFDWQPAQANYLLQNSIPQDTANKVLTFLNVTRDRIQIDSRLIRNPSSTTISGTHPEDYIPLPLSYGTNWQSIRIDSMQWNDGKLHIATTYYNNLIDAYGTVRLPVGDFKCLRWRETAIRVLEGDTTRYIEYSWIAKQNIFVAKVQSLTDVTDPVFSKCSWLERFTGMTTGYRHKNHTTQPKTIQLYQNRPNPFNSATLIEFHTHGYSWTELKIFNIQGQLVKILIADRVIPGKHVVQWDGRDLNGEPVSSGLYIYQLTCENYQKSRSLVYLK